MGAPSIREYDVRVDKLEGITKYDTGYDEDTDEDTFYSIGTLEYDTVVTVMYEENINGELFAYVGYNTGEVDEE